MISLLYNRGKTDGLVHMLGHFCGKHRVLRTITISEVNHTHFMSISKTQAKLKLCREISDLCQKNRHLYSLLI